MNAYKTIGYSAIITIIATSFIVIHPLYAIDKPQRNCIILLDRNDNDNVGRVVWFLMSRVQSAIAEQTTPILMSASLWNSFIERRINFKQKLERKNSPLYKINDLYQAINNRVEHWSNHYNELSCDAIQNKKLVAQQINKEFYTNKKNISAAHYQLLLNYYTPFNPQNWDIYKNNGGFYLFIPKKYSAQHSLVGFNIDSLEKVTDPEDTSYMYFEFQNKKSVINALPDFFLTHDNFTDKVMPYAWNIVLAGHGGSRYTEINDKDTVTWVGEPCIADLTVQEFTDMLMFFQSKVKTNFFHYASCYAGGNHISLIFKSDQKDPYNFAIICDNLTDCATYCNWTTLLPSQDKQFITTSDLHYDSTKNCWGLPLAPVYHWDDFFRNIETIDFSIGSIERLQKIMPLISYPIIANIPLLCLPETNNFFPLQQEDVIKIDDQLLAVAQTEGDCITLNEAKIVLLESSCIIPTLVLNPIEPLRIVSIKASNALHYIKKLKATHYIDLASAFWQAQYQRYNKTFIIDECTFPYAHDFKDILSQKDDLVLKNVIVTQQKDHLLRILCMINDKAMMVIAHKPVEENDQATIQEVVTMSTAAQEQYEEHYSFLKKTALES